MSYKIEITASTTAELAGKLLALAAQMQASSDPVMPEVKEAAKPKKAKAEKPTSEISPEPQPEPETAPETAPEPAPEPDEISPEPDPAAATALDFDKQVAPVVLEGVKRRGKDWVSDILSQFGVERASQVPDDRLAELVAIIKEGLA